MLDFFIVFNILNISQKQVTIVDRDERDEQNLITRRMQRSEGRSGSTNTPTLAENQISETQPESQVEVSIEDFKYGAVI